jgi:DNA repair exonuclease SbcCD ATPase subunit
MDEEISEQQKEINELRQQIDRANTRVKFDRSQLDEEKRSLERNERELAQCVIQSERLNREAFEEKSDLLDKVERRPQYVENLTAKLGKLHKEEEYLDQKITQQQTLLKTIEEPSDNITIKALKSEVEELHDKVVNCEKQIICAKGEPIDNLQDLFTRANTPPLPSEY